MLGREISVGIAEQCLGCDRQFGIVVARAQRFGGVRRGSHRIHVGIVGESGMSVVVERRYLFDLGQKAVVDLLNIGAGEWTRLGGRENRSSARNCSNKEKRA